MNIIVAPDKFKGSLTSFEVCEAIAKGIGSNEAVKVQNFPMADGGDGFAAVLKHYGKMQTVSCATVDPLGRAITAYWQWDDTQKTAVIEVAAASGLVLLKDEEKNPLLTSTYGTGLLVKDAIDKGAQKIILGLGGSATNDAGTGILAALGFRFSDGKGNFLEASGESLGKIKNILSPDSLPFVHMEIACDVQNSLYGENGAAFIYAAQKGADAEMLKTLDAGLRNFASVISRQTEKDIAIIPGTGAAGGIAAGLMAFFPVVLKSGIDMIIAASGIKTQLKEAGLLITGEGKLDRQSGEGKVVGELSKLAAQFNIPCVAICGILQLSTEEVEALGLQQAVALHDATNSIEMAIKNAAYLIERKIQMVLP